MIGESNIGIAPPGYHQHYYGERDWHAYSDLLARVVRESQPGPILDLGAGCGYLVEAATRWGVESVGLDGSLDAIRMARQRAPDIDIRLHRLSETLPFGANAFQTVILNQVIEHLEPEIMRKALKESCRILNSGGMMLIASPSRFNTAELKADPTHINLMSPSELREELINAGFENVKPFDSALPIFGRGRLLYGMASIMFKLFRIEWMSATANALAFKPNNT